MPCLQCCCRGVGGQPCSASAQHGLKAFSAQLTSVEVGGVFSMHAPALRQRPVCTPEPVKEAASCTGSVGSQQ